MTADRANVTQWLAWVLMILTGAMNRPGGTWFHPGFAYQLETFGEFLPITPPEGSFGPGPRSRPEAQAFINEWPCAVLPDEIEAGNIRALINVGGSLVTSLPETGKLIPALQHLEVFATTEIINNETTELATHVLPTKDPLERARHHHSRHPEFSRVRPAHRRGRATGRRAAVDVVGVRRNRPSARPRPGHVSGIRTAAPTTTCSQSCSRARGPSTTTWRPRVGPRPLGNYPRSGSMTTSSGWAAGGWRRRCSSISWPPSSRRRHW